MTPLFENDAALEATLRELRPAADPEYLAELDRYAAAGFPPAHRASSAREAVRNWVTARIERLRSVPPRRVLAPAGALALGAIVIATAVVAGTGGGSPESKRRGFASEMEEMPFLSKTVPAPESSERSLPAAPVGSAATVPASPPARTGPFASKTADREIERSAAIVLGTEPDGVRDAAAGVFDAVHAADGIVLDSSVTDGPSGRAGARFSLLIPSGKLGDALAEISSVAEVRSRHEATDDITAPTVSTRERLQDANATVRSALAQLAGAETDEERAAAEAELRAARSRAASIRASFASLERRANFSRLSVRIVTGKVEEGEGGVFGIGDGIDTAGRVLATLAAVTLIGLAAMTPFALIALLAWLLRRAWVQRTRRDALARP